MLGEGFSYSRLLMLAWIKLVEDTMFPQEEFAKIPSDSMARINPKCFQHDLGTGEGEAGYGL